jgi:uncharacterized protein
MNSSRSDGTQPRVFVDANTLVSGLFFEGPENSLLRMGILGLVKLVSCTLVIDEVRIVINRKFPEGEPLFGEIVGIFIILSTEDGKDAEKLIRDKKDAPILATALKNRPDYFVTGDKDYHIPEIKKRLRVVTTRELLAEIRL